jgi:hypothetical protein
MDLGNMRANGVRSVDAWCLGRGCNDHSVVDLNVMASNDVTVPSIARDLLRRPAVRRTIAGITGTLLIGLGLRIAADQRY